MNSCNPALIDIGKKLGAEKFYEYWENFGFTSKTGIELPSEEKSTFWDKELFVSPSGVTQLATASFGQRFTTTPIHLITALSAVINGGHLLEPYLVQSVTDAEGNVSAITSPRRSGRSSARRPRTWCAPIWRAWSMTRRHRQERQGGGLPHRR